MNIVIDKKVINYVQAHNYEGISLKREIQSFG